MPEQGPQSPEGAAFPLGFIAWSRAQKFRPNGAMEVPAVSFQRSGLAPVALAAAMTMAGTYATGRLRDAGCARNVKRLAFPSSRSSAATDGVAIRGPAPSSQAIPSSRVN